MEQKSAHEPGCSRRHTARQRCDGPVAEARRLEEGARERDVVSYLRLPPFWDGVPDHTRYRTYAWFGAALELVPAIAILIVWLGSQSESVKYSDFGPLPALAVLPPLGFAFRRARVWKTSSWLWVLRILLIVVAVAMWARANDHQMFQIEHNQSSWFYHDYCCRPAYLTAVHAALGGAVGASLVTAYAVGWWRINDDRRLRESSAQPDANLRHSG